MMTESNRLLVPSVQTRKGDHCEQPDKFLQEAANVAQDEQTTLGTAERLRMEAEFFDRFKEDEHSRLARFYKWGLYRHAIAYAKERLGEVKGKCVLEFGCGLGEDTLDFAQQGAQLLTFDISAAMVRGVATLVRQNGLMHTVACHRMSGEELGFADESIDLIFGRSILHHLDIPAARDEIHRVLRKGGKAVFVEPLGHNPLINLFRKLTPDRRTPSERPLTLDILQELISPFSSIKLTWWYLLGSFSTIFCYFPPSRTLFECSLQRLVDLDRLLVCSFPWLRRFCWITVIELHK